MAGAELAAVQSLAEQCRQTGQEPSIGVPVSDGGFDRRLIGCSGARLAESLITALGHMVTSECTDAGAHRRALCAIEGGDAPGATRIWRSHQAS